MDGLSATLINFKVAALRNNYSPHGMYEVISLLQEVI